MEFVAAVCCGGIFLLIIVLVVALIALYNRLVVLRNRVDNAWSQIDVQLQRRTTSSPTWSRRSRATRRTRVRRSRR